MRFDLGNFKAVRWDQKVKVILELDLEEIKDLLNKSFNLLLDIREEREALREQTFQASAADGNRLTAMKAEGRVFDLVISEWKERVAKEILSNTLWCDIKSLETLMRTGLSVVGRGYVKDFNYFVIISAGGGKGIIRLMSARPA